MQVIEITKELNRVECYIANGQPTNITLRNYDELLNQTYGTHLVYMTRPYQFGVFICQADNVSNSSLVSERGNETNSIVYDINNN